MSTAAETTGKVHVTETEFWNTVMEDVYGPRKGGAILLLDAENARKGVAKTSCAVALARLIARAFRYELSRDDFVLSGIKYLQRYQEHPGHEQPSVIVLDEFVGAGAGDKRRSMTNQNVDFGRAWQLLRAKRVITIATLPDWNEIDKRLKKLADYRIWCREKPMGYFQAYKVTVPFNAESSNVNTKGLGGHNGTQRIAFPNMDAHNDPFYTDLTKTKDELIHSETWNADGLLEENEDGQPLDPDEVERQQAVKYAIRLYEPWDDDNELTYKDVASVVDDYGKSWVGDRVNEWRDGEHRELVPDPSQ